MKSLIVLGSLLSLLTSCAGVSVPDFPACIELHPAEGYCINTVSSKEFRVSEKNKWEDKTWWELRPYMIYLPHLSWVEIKKFVINVCRKYNCDKFEIGNWERTVNKIDEAIDSPAF